MADVFTRAKRSEVMSGIRSKDTKPELAVRRTLHRLGCRFRLHAKNLPGRPDIVLRRHNMIIQVKGCFWHGHRCLKGRIPEANRAYWQPKIAGNKARDERNERRLRAMGWHVRTVWECKVRKWSEADLEGWVRRSLALRRGPKRHK